MTVTKCPADVGSTRSVPLLDVSRENNHLRKELDAAIVEVCRSGAFVHGPACAQLEAAIAAYCGTEHAVGCASGSDALLLPLMALGIGPGDEVILPSFTFFATAGAIVRLGATPVLVDVEEGSFNLDPNSLARTTGTRSPAAAPRPRAWHARCRADCRRCRRAPAHSSRPRLAATIQRRG